MTEKLSPEEIEYICAWAASGNEPRHVGQMTVRNWSCFTEWTDGNHVKLDRAGLAIAALATENQQLRDALVQANAVVECFASLYDPLDPDDLKITRANLARWNK